MRIPDYILGLQEKEQIFSLCSLLCIGNYKEHLNYVVSFVKQKKKGAKNEVCCMDKKKNIFGVEKITLLKMIVKYVSYNLTIFSSQFK